MPEIPLLPCPLCANSTFAPTPNTRDLKPLLEQWETLPNIKFPESVWATYASQSVTLYRCSFCEFAMFLPALAGDEAFYEAIMATGGLTYTPEKWEFRQAIKDIKRHNGHRVLDVGCGSGYFLQEFKRTTGMDAYGFELSHQVANIARANGHKVYDGIFPDIFVNEGKEYSFDFVCSFQVLEHVDDPVKLINSMKRLLAPKGKLILSVPDIDGPVGQFFSFELTNIPPHHVSWWGRKAFEIGMPKLGLRILDIRYEPLPDYLWQFYLPPMLNHKTRIKRLARQLARPGVIARFSRLAKFMGIKELPGVRGHTIYVLLESTT